MHLDCLLDNARIEDDLLHWDRNVVCLFNGWFSSWHELYIVDSVQEAADLTVAAIGSMYLHVDGPVHPTHIQIGIWEANITWLVIILDQDWAFSVSSK